jgi:flagellar motor switch protein FliN/FliY
MPDQTPSDALNAATPAAQAPTPQLDPADLDALTAQLNEITDAAAELKETVNQTGLEVLAGAEHGQRGASEPAGPQRAPGTEAAIRTASLGAAGHAVTFSAPELDGTGSPEAATIDLLDDVQLDVRIELGRTQMYIEDVLKLGPGCVVELDKLAGDPVDIYVNDRLIARGEVLVLNDNFCVRINDIKSPVPELEHG